jgi:Rieske Fe-S protein
MKVVPEPPPCVSCSRRDVLAGLGIVLLAACHTSDAIDTVDAPAGASCGTGEICLDLTQPGFAALTAVNGAVKVGIPGDTLMVVRTTDTDVVALSDVCTHAKCQMRYDATNHQLSCPCHGSRFTLAGQVARGPATRAVKVYAAVLDVPANQVRITVA